MKRHDRGFTLLEVMVSLALLSIFLLIIVRTVGQAVMLKTHEEKIITATRLAQGKMVDVQIQLAQDGWGSQENEECGDFSRDYPDYADAYKDFSWCWELKKVKLHIPPELLNGALGGDDDKKDAKAGTAGTANAGDLMSSLGIDMGTVTEDLSKGIRLLTVKVKWKVGTEDEQVVLSRQMVSMSQVEGGPFGGEGVAGVPGAPGAPGATGGMPGAGGAPGGHVGGGPSGTFGMPGGKGGSKH